MQYHGPRTLTMDIFFVMDTFISLRRLLGRDALSVLSLTGEPSKLEENQDTSPTAIPCFFFFEEMKTY